jgi:acetyl-CoA acetyltransferase family protein
MMLTPVIVGAARTAIGTAYKGTLASTPAETLACLILEETVRRSGLPAERFDDVIFAESLYGGGDLARFAGAALGLTTVPGVAVNRHCAGSLTSIGLAAAAVRSGMDSAIVAGGVESSSMAPSLTWRLPDGGSRNGIPPTHPDRPDAPNSDMSISVGWNTARKAGISRREMDEWAYRSHMRAIAATDAGAFANEIVPVKVERPDRSALLFSVDEHPRRATSVEKLAALKVLHPEIEGFSITAGNSSGINDAAAAVAVVRDDVAAAEGLEGLATVLAWAAAGVNPALMGFGAIRAADKALSRAGRLPRDVTVWEINEAFASVPIAACRELGLDEDQVNVVGSGCSLGHPVAASGARMVTSLTYELRRRGGGLGVAAMCAGGGQGAAVVIEV